MLRFDRCEIRCLKRKLAGRKKWIVLVHRFGFWIVGRLGCRGVLCLGTKARYAHRQSLCSDRTDKPNPSKPSPTSDFSVHGLISHRGKKTNAVRNAFEEHYRTRSIESDQPTVRESSLCTFAPLRSLLLPCLPAFPLHPLHPCAFAFPSSILPYPSSLCTFAPLRLCVPFFSSAFPSSLCTFALNPAVSTQLRLSLNRLLEPLDHLLGDLGMSIDQVGSLTRVSIQIEQLVLR